MNDCVWAKESGSASSSSITIDPLLVAPNYTAGLRTMTPVALAVMRSAPISRPSV